MRSGQQAEMRSASFVFEVFWIYRKKSQPFHAPGSPCLFDIPISLHELDFPSGNAISASHLVGAHLHTMKTVDGE